MRIKDNLSSIALLLILTSVFVFCSNDNEDSEDISTTTSSTVVVTITEDTKAPIFVTEPQITEVTSDSVNISWLVEDDYGAPEVQISLNDEVIYKGKDTQYQITNLEPDTTYPLVIIATDLNNNLVTKTFTITTNPILDIEPPRFLKALTLDSVSFNSAIISWEVEDLLSDFELTLEVNSQAIESFSTPFELFELSPNTKYIISLIAKDDAGNISSNTLGFQTPPDPNIIQTSINFSSPLQISQITSDSAVASWNVQDQSGMVSYTLFIGDEIIYSGQDNSYTLTDLEPENYYELDLTAVDESNTEIFSFTSFTTSEYIDDINPIFINELKASNVTSSSISLTWEASDNIGVDYYILKESGNQVYKGSQEERTLEGLEGDQLFNFSVEAFDKEGNSVLSSLSVQTLTPPTTTTNYNYNYNYNYYYNFNK